MWLGIGAPKNTPAPVIDILSKAIDKAAATDQFKTIVHNLGQEYAYLNAKDFAAFWAADAKHADEAVRLIGRQG